VTRSRQLAAKPPGQLTEVEWQARQHTRESRKVIGLLLLALFILALAFFRYGKTIPWGAR
jgi:hypothetical protein